MTFRNRFLFLIVGIVFILGMVREWRNHYRTADEYDAPRRLSGKTQTIDIRHRETGCDCPDWELTSQHADTPARFGKEFLYIEPGHAGMDVPAAYWALADSGYVLQLTGQFYKGEAIPYDYTQKTDQKPQKARVFYYTASAVVKPE